MLGHCPVYCLLLPAVLPCCHPKLCCHAIGEAHSPALIPAGTHTFSSTRAFHYVTKFRSHVVAHKTLHLQCKLRQRPCFRIDPVSTYVSLLSNKFHLGAALHRGAILQFDGQEGPKQQPKQMHSGHVPFTTRLLQALSLTPEGLYTRPEHAC